MATIGGMKRPFLLIVCAVIPPAIAACSNYESKFAREASVTLRNNALAGAYEGTWTSSNHPGGGGKLWCILNQQGESDYLAEFKATWHGVFSSTHEVVLRTQRGKSRSAGTKALTFSGEAPIKMFIGAGTYQCEGRMDGRRIQARYDATYDRGNFELKRVNAAKAGQTEPSAAPLGR